MVAVAGPESRGRATPFGSSWGGLQCTEVVPYAAGSRGRTTLLGTSRRQLLVRPVVYGLLAVAVCFAAATMPTRGHSDRADAAVSNPGPVGNGFTVTPADLAFILKQIKIAERHSRAFLGHPDAPTPLNPDPSGDPEYCQSLVGPGPDQIPDRVTSYGLRTVDGSCNNLFPNRDKFAAASPMFGTDANGNFVSTPDYVAFPRLTTRSSGMPRPSRQASSVPRAALACPRNRRARRTSRSGDSSSTRSRASSRT